MTAPIPGLHRDGSDGQTQEQIRVTGRDPPGRHTPHLRDPDGRVQLHPPGVDGAHARRREALHDDHDPRGRHGEDADRADAHALQRQVPRRGHPQPRHRHGPARGRRGPRSRRLHPRLPGRARPLRLQGEVHHDHAGARALQRGRRRPGHRRLGHGGVAGGERGGQQRPRRHHRHLLRRPPHPDGPHRPPPGAEGGGPSQLHGRLMARRRLLPPRGLPHRHVPVRLPADLDEGRQPLRPLGLPRPLPGHPRGRLPRRAGPPLRGRPAAGLEAPPGAPRVRRLLARPGPAGTPGPGAAAGARAQRPQPLRRRGPLRRRAQPRGDGRQRPPGRAHPPGHRPLVPRPDLERGLVARQPQVGGGHLPALPPGDAQALLRPPPQEEAAGRAAAAGDRLRDREPTAGGGTGAGRR